MKTIAEALDAMLPSFQPLARERLAIADALGLHAATQLTAREDAPPFDNSAMDGYAVRTVDLHHAAAGSPVTLPLVGESRAGGPPPGPLAEGSVMRIFTGAPMPTGADAVVMQEDTRREGDDVALLEAPSAGRHVRPRGSDIKAGAPMIATGGRIGPGEIALLASQSYASVDVHRRPRVALFSTGDELRDIGEPRDPGTIVNSNAYGLAAQIRAAGGEPWVLPRAPDTLDDIVACLESALEADVVITSGGVSVGEYDLMHEAFAKAGVEMGFWKVAIKPGKPLAFGRRGDTPVIGLPGNPVSSFVTFEVFVRPGLRRMLGDPSPHPMTLRAELASAHRHRRGRTELAQVRLERVGETLRAHLRPSSGSGSVPSLAGLDGLALLAGEIESFEAGHAVEVMPLRPLGAASFTAA